MRDKPAITSDALAVLAIVAVLICACSCGSGQPARTQSAGQQQAQSSGSGPLQTQGGDGPGLQGPPSHHQSGIYSGRYSAAFARCMRANGVPDFPYSDGGHLTGISTISSQFQSALYGACKSLAPAEWVSVP